MKRSRFTTDANKRRIKEVFGKFGIDISSVRTLIASTLALYEIVFVPDWRSLQMSSLEDEIYHSLSARGIRIVPSLRGNGTVGIYVIVPRLSKK